jgi:hypothetical protein
MIPWLILIIGVLVYLLLIVPRLVIGLERLPYPGIRLYVYLESWFVYLTNLAEEWKNESAN